VGKEVQRRASRKWEAKNRDKLAEKQRLKRKAEKILLEIKKS